MIVDCHMHTWRYPDHFNKKVMLSYQPPRRREWPEEKFKEMWENPIDRYLPLMEGVDKAIILGLRTWDTLGIDTPNDYLARIAKEHPGKLNWCCCVVPTEKNAAEEIERCVKELGAIGVGELSPAYAGYYPNDERCFPVYEIAQKLEIPIIMHAGPAQPRFTRLKYANPLYLDDVAIQFPDLKIVICHLGYYKYEDAIFLIQKHENVFGDISWLNSISGLERITLPKYLPTINYPFLHYLYPLIYYFTQTFGGTDKLIWGSDWSASRPSEGINNLQNINELLIKHNLPVIPEKSIHNILHENWKKVFNLSS